MMIENQADSEALQQDLSQLESWAKTWQMEFNARKCFVLHITNKRQAHCHKYTLNNIELATVHDHSYLGITIDDKLNWNAHMDQTSLKASRSLNFIRRNLCLPAVGVRYIHLEPTNSTK